MDDELDVQITLFETDEGDVYQLIIEDSKPRYIIGDKDVSDNASYIFANYNKPTMDEAQQLMDLCFIDYKENNMVDGILKYPVYVLNDDTTPFTSAVAILESVFHVSHEKAEELANEVHTKGKALVGEYIYEIAEQKVYEVDTICNEHDLEFTAQVDESVESEALSTLEEKAVLLLKRMIDEEINQKKLDDDSE